MQWALLLTWRSSKNDQHGSRESRCGALGRLGPKHTRTGTAREEILGWQCSQSVQLVTAWRVLGLGDCKPSFDH
jgi:hypothetical protein